MYGMVYGMITVDIVADLQNLKREKMPMQRIVECKTPRAPKGVEENA